MFEIEEEKPLKKGKYGLEDKVYRFGDKAQFEEEASKKKRYKNKTIRNENKNKADGLPSSSSSGSDKKKSKKEMESYILSLLLQKTFSDESCSNDIPQAPMSSSCGSSLKGKEKVIEVEEEKQENDNNHSSRESEVEESKSNFLNNNIGASIDTVVEVEASTFGFEVEEEEYNFDLVTDKEEELCLEWEVRTENIKKGNMYIRSKQKNKHEKVNYHRYVNFRDQKKDEELESYLSQYYGSVKHNRQIKVAKEVSMMNFQRPCRNFKSSPTPNQNKKNPLGLPEDVFQAIEKLQWKQNITPEDYDLLLRLDDTVKPRTVSPHKLRTVPQSKPSLEKCCSGIVCSVCLEPYSTSEYIKTLPCGHDFHSKCIDYWLMNSSQNCPLDGLPAFSS